MWSMDSIALPVKLSNKLIKSIEDNRSMWRCMFSLVEILYVVEEKIGSDVQAMEFFGIQPTCEFSLFFSN